MYPNSSASGDFYFLFSIIILLGFVIFVVRRQMGPTANKETIDRSIVLLDERICGRPGDYVPEEAAFLAFRENCIGSREMEAMAVDILRHCGMEAERLTVLAKEELSQEHAAGTYQEENGRCTITIRVSANARWNVVLAVLIHECMHYFLRHSAIAFAQTKENEILTDTATVYMGFYEFIYRGYIFVGYLRDSEIRYVRDQLVKIL